MVNRLSGPGSVRVDSLLEWDEGWLVGPGNIELFGRGISSSTGFQIDGDLILKSGASMTWSTRGAFDKGSLIVEEGALLD